MVCIRTSSNQLITVDPGPIRPEVIVKPAHMVTEHNTMAQVEESKVCCICGSARNCITVAEDRYMCNTCLENLEEWRREEIQDLGYMHYMYGDD